VSGGNGPPDPATRAALIAFIAFVTCERLFELWLSARNARRLAARGAVEHGRGHFPLFVALHVLFPLALVAEVLFLGTRPGTAWPAWLALLVAAEALRLAAIRALGGFWNVRIWVLPGAEPVRRGPYRFLRHPNYLAVTLELLAAPMMFGAWRTALVVTALNAAALAVRIPAEERALQGAAPQAPGR